LKKNNLHTFKLRKKIILFIGVVFLIFTLYWLNSLIFILHLGKGQLHLIMRAQPLHSAVLQDEKDSTSRAQIFEILKFSEALGLAPGKSYSTYVHHDQPLMYVVSAAVPYPFRAHYWKYPIVGEMGYRGFFSKKMALTEKQKLQKQGMAVSIRPVSAFSTLGWFSDPITTYLLRLPEGRRAETLIHEIFHSHVYIKNNDRLSENMASHVGEEAAKLYLQATYGPEHDAYFQYLNQLETEEIWRTFLLNCAEEIERWPKLNARDYVRRFIEFRSRARQLPFADNSWKEKIWKNHIPNHADFVVGQQYSMYRDSLKQELEEVFSGDLVQQIANWKIVHGN